MVLTEDIMSAFTSFRFTIARVYQCIQTGIAEISLPEFKKITPRTSRMLKKVKETRIEPLLLQINYFN